MGRLEDCGAVTGSVSDRGLPFIFLFSSDSFIISFSNRAQKIKIEGVEAIRKISIISSCLRDLMDAVETRGQYLYEVRLNA